jgi:nitrite reductase/ring-hydroxylating ferredoxin subunit/uncharacterized membrane protein
MLIPLPIGLAVAALLVDVLAVVRDVPAAYWAGRQLVLAAILTGVLAAVPGLIDFLGVVPPKSEARGRAVRHLLANGTGLLLLVASWVLRRRGVAPAVPIGLEAATLACFGVGGFLGGRLVYHNQIGVNHRQAGAGEWREIRLSDVQAAPVVARPHEMRPGQMKLVHVNRLRVVLARVPDGWAAFEDRCPHQGGSLADGMLAGSTVQCPWCGSQFDAHTGHVLAGPATRPIRTWPVVEELDQVRLELAPAGEFPVASGVGAPPPPLPM